MSVVRWIVGWAVAVVVAAALGSIIQTQYNLARLAGLGESFSTRTRLDTTLFDLVSFAPTYAVVMALALLIALVVAGVLVRYLGRWPMALFVLAGFAAVAAALGLMSAMLPVTVISAARSAGGFILLCLAGALGAWLHALIITRRRGTR